MEFKDKGPWIVASETGHKIESDYFTPEVTLTISGDFGSDADRVEYAKGLCDVLNKSSKQIGLPTANYKDRHIEKGYNMNFGQAIEQLEAGNKMARSGWNGKGIFIKLQVPDANSKMTHPYIYIDTTGLQSDNQDAPRSLVPWLASQTDMLAKDWAVV